MELARDRAPADAELEAPAGEQIGGRGLLGAAQRVVERQQDDGGPDADPPGTLGDRRHRHERARQQRERAAEVDLREPGYVEAQLVAERDEVQHLGEPFGVGAAGGLGRLEEQAESRHGACAHTA